MGTIRQKCLEEKDGCAVYAITLTIVVEINAISVVHRGVRRRLRKGKEQMKTKESSLKGKEIGFALNART